MKKTLRLSAWVAAALCAVAAHGCSELDASLAHRCETHVDCNVGRMCERGRCVPIRLIGFDSNATEFPIIADAETAPPPDKHADSGERDSGVNGGAGSGELGQAGSAATDGAVAGTGNAAPPSTPAAAGSGRGTRQDEDAGSLDDGGTDSRPDCSDRHARLPGVVLWLDAAKGISADAQQHVQQWADQSPQAHLARSVGEEEDWPLLLTDTGQGQPALRFGFPQSASHARRMLVNDHMSLQFGYADFAVIAVLRYRNSTAIDGEQLSYAASVYAKVCDCEGYPGAALFANDDFPTAQRSAQTTRSSFMLQTRWGNVVRGFRTGLNDDRTHLVVGRRDDFTLTLEVDGNPDAVVFTENKWDVSAGGYAASIGAHARDDIQALDGDIFELIAIVDAPDSVGAIARCLQAKYSLNQ